MSLPNPRIRYSRTDQARREGDDSAEKSVAAMTAYHPHAVLALAVILALISVVLAVPSNETVALLPGVPSSKVYIEKPVPFKTTPGAYFSVNVTGNPLSAFMLIITRDTTRAGLTCYWSTTKQRPSGVGNDPHFDLLQQNNGRVFPLVAGHPGMYYFGVYIMEGTPAAAYFSAMVTFYNNSQFAPLPNGNITLSTRLLSVTNPTMRPSVIASWYPIPRYRNFTFYKFPHECGLNSNVNDLNYLVENATPFLDVQVQESEPFVSAELTDFEDDIDSFCINLVAKDDLGRPVTSWLAQTLYYPHIRDGIEPEPVNIKKWTPGVWTAVVLTAMLFIGAPIGIIVHRIWLSRRRAQKRREALLESSQTWVN